uniref:4656HH n=1 Tax=Dugesia japonica TaxID=6161 RepID=C9K4W2_DUGJA|nr:4656HH [Dugesia japonica]
MTAVSDEYQWHTNYNLEVAILYSIAALGIILNFVQTLCILIEKEIRNLLSAFLIHGAIINAVLASYCVVFALSLHDKSFQNLCKYLGSSYIVIMTANIFNLIAIIASEVYKLNFYECDLNNNNSKYNNICCVIFGLSIVYVSSLILHLGPTLIGGNFNFDSQTGFCLFIFGQTKNYVVFVVWIIIVTLVLAACTYYLISLHSNLNRLIYQHSTISSRTSLQKNQKVTDELILTKSRAWTLSCVTGLHVLCWYPLFGLLISDKNFLIPIGLYRALTCLAWSNSFLEPLIYLLLDRKMIRCCLKLVSNSRLVNNEINRSSRLQRIGDRLKSAPLENDFDIELRQISNYDCAQHLERSQNPDYRTWKNNNFLEC